MEEEGATRTQWHVTLQLTIFRLKMYNIDGSDCAVCGNATRCAAYLVLESAASVLLFFPFWVYPTFADTASLYSS
jgi:hypothetical protein